MNDSTHRQPATDSRQPSADPHKPLRDDVRRLGELLGQTLQAHGGPDLLARVERVRALSKRAREDDAAFDELARELSGMPVDAALPVARAFAHFLTLPTSPNSTIASGAAAPTSAIRRRRRSADPATTSFRGCSRTASARSSCTRPCARSTSSWC